MPLDAAALLRAEPRQLPAQAPHPVQAVYPDARPYVRWWWFSGAVTEDGIRHLRPLTRVVKAATIPGTYRGWPMFQAHARVTLAVLACLSALGVGGMVAAVAVCVGVATVIGWLAFRFGIAGTYFALLTIAFAEFALHARAILGLPIPSIRSFGPFPEDTRVPLRAPVVGSQVGQFFQFTVD